MCGIIGFTGKLKAQDVLLTGLASLEYRGYDSAGIAYFKDTGKISLRKTVGKVKDLRAICDDDNNSTCGIGHTRWATHGGVTNANAHPHKVGQVALLINKYLKVVKAGGVQFCTRILIHNGWMPQKMVASDNNKYVCFNMEYIP